MSRTDNILDRSLSTYPSNNEILNVPRRRGTKRPASQPWDRQFSDLDSDQIEQKRINIGEELRVARRTFKRQVSMDYEYWNNYANIARLQQEQSRLESQRELEMRFQEGEGASDWYEDPEAEKLKREHDTWGQLSSIMQKHRLRLQNRFEKSRESFLRLFATSTMGLNLGGKGTTTGNGRRDSKVQSRFVKDMVQLYCPNQKYTNFKWEPVMGCWLSDKQCNAAHLFPVKQSFWMDEIFGKGASNELFSPRNGIFLEEAIKKALDQGKVAIVPDIDLDPKDPELPLLDQQERVKRAKQWENAPVKEYKFVILKKNDKKIKTDTYLAGLGCDVSTIAELDGRKLVFLTDFRPRSRYIWWTWMNAILQNAWNQSSSDENMAHIEVQKSTRYWGTRRKYVKRNHLLGFVEELGQDVESILEFGEGDEDDEYAPGVMEALLQESLASSKDSDDEDDDEDDDDDDDGEKDQGEGYDEEKGTEAE
ncbi:hypothetical protein F53441_332 [Fusarium austroafricanum]|uniref:HNH nuclease domain-containing protein n=1 Tax=Fusarium austroafricanum TaxID=2364996 RepID=A0A8H4P596_9HYPO|nr:hypothetical protein F53441_332 [Fusarium austroafricanum]